MKSSGKKQKRKQNNDYTPAGASSGKGENMTEIINEQPTIYAAFTAQIERNVRAAQRAGATPAELEERNARLIRARDMMPLAVAEAGMVED